MDEKKVREAIEIMKTFRRGKQERKKLLCFHGNDKYNSELLERKIEACNTAIEALEKQLMKKVEMRTEYRDINGELVCFDGFCPSCGNTVNSDRNKSCNRCGQKLDRPEYERGRMKEQTFEDILYMIKRSCDKNFYKGTDYDGIKPEIVRCATDIYIEQMRQQGGKRNE